MDILRKQLQQLETVLRERESELEPWRLSIDPRDPEPQLEIRTPDGTRVELPLSWRAGKIGHSAAASWTAEQEGHVLAAPVIGREIAARLRKARASFLDSRGTIFLFVDHGRFVLDVRAGRASGSSRPREFGVFQQRARRSLAAPRILFTLLTQPESITWTVRQLAAAANTSPQSASNTLRVMREQGRIVRAGKSGHVWARSRPHGLIDEFADAWRDGLRAHQSLALLDSTETPAQVEERIEQLLGDQGMKFGFGGSAGATRISPWYRGRATVVHVDGDWKPAFNRRLRTAPTNQDPTVVVLRTMTKQDLVPETLHAHPLLLYVELIASSDPREQEHAERILPSIVQDFKDHEQAMV